MIATPLANTSMAMNRADNDQAIYVQTLQLQQPVQLPMPPTYNSPVMTQEEAAQGIGYEFVVRYYTTMHEAPELMHRLYAESASLTRGNTSVRGANNIKAFIETLSFNNLKVRVRKLDTQPTLDSGILITIKGEISDMDMRTRCFQQTFILGAYRPYWYYVFNDIFHYHDEVYGKANASVQCQHGSISVQVEVERPPVLASSTMPTCDVENYRVVAHVSVLRDNPSTSLPPADGLSMPAVNNAVEAPLLEQQMFPLASPPVVVLAGESAACSVADRTQSFEPLDSVALLEPETNVTPEPSNVSIVESSSSLTANSKISIHDFPFLPKNSDITPLNITEPQSNQPLKSLWSDEMKEEEEMAAKTIVSPPLKQNEPISYAKIISSSLYAKSPPYQAPDLSESIKASNSYIPSVAFTNNNQPLETKLTDLSAVKAQNNVSIYQKESPPSAQARQRTFSQHSRRASPVQQLSTPQKYFDQRSGDRRSSNVRSRNWNEDNCELFIGNIPHCATKEDIKKIFAAFGNVQSFRLLSKPAEQVGQGRRPPNYGFLEFESPKSVDMCLNNGPIVYNTQQGVAVRLNVRSKNGDVERQGIARRNNNFTRRSLFNSSHSMDSETASSDRRNITILKPLNTTRDNNSRPPQSNTAGKSSAVENKSCSQMPKEQRRMNNKVPQATPGTALELGGSSEVKAKHDGATNKTNESSKKTTGKANEQKKTPKDNFPKLPLSRANNASENGQKNSNKAASGKSNKR